eukprot:3744231-Rhodomonas_salina.1
MLLPGLVPGAPPSSLQNTGTVLRARYAMSGTDVACAVPGNLDLQWQRRWVCYAPTRTVMPAPVLAAGTRMSVWSYQLVLRRCMVLPAAASTRQTALRRPPLAAPSQVQILDISACAVPVCTGRVVFRI